MKPVEDLGTSNWKVGDSGLHPRYGKCKVIEVNPYWLKVRVTAKPKDLKFSGKDKDEIWIPDDSLTEIK